MTARKYAPAALDLAVRRSTTGLGLFTNVAISKTTCIIEYVGVPLAEEQVSRSRSRYLFEISPGVTIDGSPRWNRARYINHSCRPNCEAVAHRGRILIFSLRRIRPGEELHYDYGKDYVSDYLRGGCRCTKCETPRT